MRCMSLPWRSENVRDFGLLLTLYFFLSIICCISLVGGNLLMVQSATRKPRIGSSLSEGFVSSQSADFDATAKGSTGGGIVVLCIGALSGGLIVFIIGLLQSWCVRC